nr:hypothetical protein [uncultured Sphaerochaeta sp.]
MDIPIIVMVVPVCTITENQKFRVAMPYVLNYNDHSQTIINKHLESLVIKHSYVSHCSIKSAINIALVALLLLSIGLVFMSCSLEQGSAHMIPIFRSALPFERSIRSSASDYSFAIPPIEGWKTEVVPTGTSAIDIEIFGTTVPCTIEEGNNYVRFTGANENIDLDFTVFANGKFSYTGTMLFTKSDNTVLVVESSLEDGEISGDFISGTSGIARAWEVTSSSDDNDTGTARLLSLTYDVHVENGTPSFTTNTIDHTDKPSWYVAPSEIDHSKWEEKKLLFDEEFPSSSETPEEVTYTFNNGVWE